MTFINHWNNAVSNTTTTTSSGIGSNKYITSGKSSTLFDFIYLGQYEQGLYYEDIDFVSKI